MRTAWETRNAAWKILGEGGAYGKYLVGCILLSLVTAGIVLGACLLGMAGAAALRPYVAPLLDGVAPSLVSGQEPAAYWAWAGDLVRSFFNLPPLVIGALLALGVLVTAVIMYAVAFANWSTRALALATTRKGLTIMHAFSGRGHAWRMFLLLVQRDTMVLLGLLLFVVPGVRMMFNYALAPYLLIDHPDWSSSQCLEESARLMEGHRMRYFILFLSFIGWYLLAFVARCLIGDFAFLLLTPYTDTAYALFYEERLDFSEDPLGCSGVNPNQETERNKSNDES